MARLYWTKEVVPFKQNHGLLHLQSENNSSIILKHEPIRNVLYIHAHWKYCVNTPLADVILKDTRRYDCKSIIKQNTLSWKH